MTNPKTPPDRTPFWVCSTKCQHEWIAAYIPMDAANFVKIGRRIICPMCGCTKVNCHQPVQVWTNTNAESKP